MKSSGEKALCLLGRAIREDSTGRRTIGRKLAGGGLTEKAVDRLVNVKIRAVKTIPVVKPVQATAAMVVFLASKGESVTDVMIDWSMMLLFFNVAPLHSAIFLRSSTGCELEITSC